MPKRAPGGLKPCACALLLAGCATTNRGVASVGALTFEGAAPRNLLFLSIDTLRRDRVDGFGATGVTPFLGELAERSVVLADHQQCSGWTLPGVTCTLAGRTNLELGHAPRPGGDQGQGVRLTGEQPLLATWLAEAGFETGLVSSNLWLSPELGSGVGYERVEHGGAGAVAVRERGLELLRDSGNGPWFVHLHHMEPHWPYVPDEDWIVGEGALAPWPEDLHDAAVQERWRDAWPTLPPADQALLAAHLKVLYEAEIRTLDARLAVTWDELEAGGWLDDTLVVVWSDHGEQVFDHGWAGHAYGLAADENDAIAMFWARNLRPGRWEGGTTATDLVPTVLAALGQPIPAVVSGRVVGTAPEGRPRYAEILGYGGVRQSVTVGKEKLVFSWDDGRLERFDRTADPAEVEPLAGGEALWELLAPKVAQLEAILGEGR